MSGKEDIVILPEMMYNERVEDGRTVVYCTLRQLALHTVGLDHDVGGDRLYTRHGRKYYKPYRNYFSGRMAGLDLLVEAGYMDCHDSIVRGEPYRSYSFNRAGLDWLGEQIGIIIKDKE